MKIWNVGKEEIRQLYNNLLYIIKPGEIKDFNEDLAAFLLSKHELRGKGLVQLKDGDNKSDRYIQGREQIFEWATEKHNDYIKHGEERSEANKQPIPPHAAIREYQELIKEYEEWADAGYLMPDEMQDKKAETTSVYACPYCDKEFTSKSFLKGHMIHHGKEAKGVNAEAVEGQGSGES